MQLRAEFDNAKEQLLPGQFVRVELTAGARDNVFLVPQAAVMQTEKAFLVFVVDRRRQGGAAHRADGRMGRLRLDRAVGPERRRSRRRRQSAQGASRRGGDAEKPPVAAAAPGPDGQGSGRRQAACRRRSSRSPCRNSSSSGRYSPAVISILFVLAGLIAAKVLPIAQYPEISPPTVTITANYPGASAETLAKTVAAPIEEQLSGVENLVYFSSSSASNGALTITATFEVGADVNKAVIDVNNRIAIALPRLPDDVRRNGVVAQKRSTDILFVVALSLERPALRHAVPVELRDGQRPRRAEARARRGRRDDLRRARLLDAHLAAARQDGARSASRPPTSPTRSACRTTSTPPARSARSPRRRASRWCTRSRPADG